jgi:hypothetical protein
MSECELHMIGQSLEYILNDEMSAPAKRALEVAVFDQGDQRVGCSEDVIGLGHRRGEHGQ